jgi:hypothetical protein
MARPQAHWSLYGSPTSPLVTIWLAHKPIGYYMARPKPIGYYMARPQAHWLLYGSPTSPFVYYMARPQAHWLLYGSPTYILKPFAHRMHLCVLYGSQNKHELFPLTALTVFFN